MTDSSTPDPRVDGPPDWDVLARYLAGEALPDEARAVDAWMAEHPEDAAMLAALDTTVGGGVVPERGPALVAGDVIDVERALVAVRARRDAAPMADRTVLPFRPSHRRAAAGAPATALGAGRARRGRRGDRHRRRAWT